MFVVLVEFAAGTFAITWLTDLKNEVGRSFLSTQVLTCLVLVALARFLTDSVTFKSGDQLYKADQTWVGLQGVLLIVWLVALALYTLMVWFGTDRARWWVGGAATIIGIATLLADALVYRGTYLGGWIAPVSFVAAAVASGGVLCGMLLGHWYLVTPALTVAPLLRINFIYMWGLLAQGVLVLVNAGPWASGATGVLLTDFAPIFWLRVIVGIIFPLVLGWMTWQTCKIKSHQSSTGFLYVALACVIAGEIVSKVLLFSTGVPL